MIRFSGRSVWTPLPGGSGPVAGNPHDSNEKWYFNTQTPTFTWTASTDPDAPDGTPGSGLESYWFQFGLLSDKPGVGTDSWPGAIRDRLVSPNGTGTELWTPILPLGLVAGEEYAARVKAYDDVGNESAWVDPPLIFDPDKPTKPGMPTAISPTIDRTPAWEWVGSTDAISGVDGYDIQIRRFSSDDWDVLDTFLDIPDDLNPADPQIWEQGLQLEDGTRDSRAGHGRRLETTPIIRHRAGHNRCDASCCSRDRGALTRATRRTRSRSSGTR